MITDTPARSANSKPGQAVIHSRASAKNEALQLEKFMSKACPVMEQVVEENEQLRFINNRQAAAQRNAVEQKSALKFPEELLMMLGTMKMTA
jgi:hypothetical protein